ncbi:hypothetical protein HMI54_002817 [Coelomomyces lativittatus]|nr:hypothetical protein HMI54_002817 [Coelomomyces lativittatus]
MNLLPIGQLDGGRVAHGLFGSRGHRIIARVVFIALLYYSCIGAIDLHGTPDDLALWIAGAALFLYISLTGLGLSRRDTMMYALLILASLIVIGYLLPTLQGYSGYIGFMFIIGRFIGVDAPPAVMSEPLDTKRVILGWLALFILIITFSPFPLE